MRLSRVAVVGAGVAGQGAYALLEDAGVETQVFSQSHPQDSGFPVTVNQDPTLLAASIISFQPDTVVVSPGIPPHSPVLTALEEARIPVIGEVELAWRYLDKYGRVQGSEPKLLGITGTNGKTTTVGMTAAILRANGTPAVQAGNVGFPITKAVLDQPAIIIAELSSFQLETTSTMNPFAAVCLNAQEDHLDWHGNVEEYWSAKAQVYRGVTDSRLFFVDDPRCASMAEQASHADAARLIGLSFGSVTEGRVGVVEGRIVDHAFSDKPRVVADLTGIPLLVAAAQNDAGERDPLVRDALAATALALSCGATPAAVQQGLTDFVLDGHRGHQVGTQGGVVWINNSKATNTHAAASALQQWTGGKIVWIVGGQTKGQDLSGVIAQVRNRLRAAVIIGSNQKELAAVFADKAPQVPLAQVDGTGSRRRWMLQAVTEAAAFAEPGDAVMLAPAAASWDQFVDYKQRGEVFEQSVEQLLRQVGE